MIVLSSHINNRKRDTGRLQAMAHLNAGIVVEMYVENDADRLFEVAVLLKCVGGWKQYAVVAVLPKKPLDPPRR